MILIDLEKEEIYQPSEAQPEVERLREPFKSVFFKTDTELLVQNSLGVFQFQIVYLGDQENIPYNRDSYQEKSPTGRESIPIQKEKRRSTFSQRSTGRNTLTSEAYRIDVQEYKILSHYESLVMLGVRKD